MTLAKIILELRYKEINHVFNWRSSIYKGITGNKPPQDIGFNESFELTIEDKQAKLLLEPKRWAIEIEKIDSPNDIQSYLTNLYVKVNSVVNWGIGQRIGVRTIWISEYPGPISDLINTMKKAFYAEREPITSATDIALNLTLTNMESKVNYILGPMEKTNITHHYFTAHIENNLPSVFTLMDIDYFLLKDRTYNKKQFNEYLNEAFHYSESKGLEVEKIIL